MKQMGKWGLKGLVGLFGMAASAAYAGSAPGGVVGYAPGSVAVPTLSEWTLIGLGLLLMVVAYRVLRTRANGRLLANLLVLGGAAAGRFGRAFADGQCQCGGVSGGRDQRYRWRAPGDVDQCYVYGVQYDGGHQTITSISAVGGAFESDPWPRRVARSACRCRLRRCVTCASRTSRPYLFSKRKLKVDGLLMADPAGPPP